MNPLTLATRLLLLWLLLAGAATAAQRTALVLGVFPYFSPEQLATLYRPLADHLEARLGRPVRLVSAPDFATFKRRTAAGRYDILVTAPHLGRIAERRNGYRWLALTRNRSEAVFVSRRDSGIHTLGDLRGRRLALPPPLAIVHQMALETLERLGMEPQHDLRLLPRKSHDQALYAVIQGDADAAAFGLPTWRRYRAPEKRALVVIGRSASIPGFAILAHPRLGEPLLERLREALFAFPDTAEGRHFFDATALEGVRPVTHADRALLDHYLARIRAAREAGDP
ncbi:MAG TPA: phosphate/phosphite/phosphonate ABC transporter substrate-binding protein [Gammaproteobacteria bacterium]|nr:phosphate/phosphite/phosphonate ABC transporter substrate-binding protein [Gammaproteobacteria bacterium]